MSVLGFLLQHWLIENEWIRPSERNFSIYVKKFEVYLPIKPTYPHMFYATANPVLHNQVIPGSTEYIIIPSSPLVYEYAVGPSRLNCHGPKFMNPYTSCESTDISEVCELSHAINHRLYPSIYSQWTLSVKGDQHYNLITPDPATNLSVIVGMRLCNIAPEQYDTYSSLEVLYQETQQQQCCPEGKYRPNVYSDCMECPKESHSALAGYYCENDREQPLH